MHELAKHGFPALPDIKLHNWLWIMVEALGQGGGAGLPGIGMAALFICHASPWNCPLFGFVDFPIDLHTLYITVHKMCAPCVKLHLQVIPAARTALLTVHSHALYCIARYFYISDDPRSLVL